MRPRRFAYGRDKAIMNAIKRFLRNERGATAIEYGLIVALVAVTAIAAMQALGNEFSDTLTVAGDAMAGV